MMFVWKDQKQMEKEAGIGTFFKKVLSFSYKSLCWILIKYFWNTNASLVCYKLKMCQSSITTLLNQCDQIARLPIFEHFSINDYEN